MSTVYKNTLLNQHYMTLIIPPLQRTLRVFSHGQIRIPAWISEATPLERVGIAQYASQEMESIGLLSSLESLIGAENAINPRKIGLLDNICAEHPCLDASYLTSITSNKWNIQGLRTAPPWSLGTDLHWRTLSEESQLLIVRYAALTKNILRPKYSGEIHANKVADVLRSTSNTIRNDSMLQSIIACNNPSLINSMIRAKDPLCENALAFGFLNRPENMNRAAYATMDDTTFVALTMYDKTALLNSDAFQRLLNANRTLHRYPWNKLPLIFEHHPARFIQSVITSSDVANAHTHVKRWFIPMLHATVKRAAADPCYAQLFVDSILSGAGKKRFNSIIERHAPDAYAVLNLTRQLYDCDDKKTEAPALRAWIDALAAQQNTLNENVLPVDAAVFAWEI